MKVLVVSVYCLLTFIIFISADTVHVKVQELISDDDLEEFEQCKDELNITDGDWYSEEEIVGGNYTEAGSEERKRKHGCFIMCLLKKGELMEGSNILETKVHAEISKEMADSPSQAKVHKVARNCLREVKDITEECEKGFSLLTCVMKAVHKALMHEEHEEHEKHE